MFAFLGNFLLTNPIPEITKRLAKQGEFGLCTKQEGSTIKERFAAL